MTHLYKIEEILLYLPKKFLYFDQNNSEEFLDNCSKVVHELAPINKKLIEKRETIQKEIDDWHKLRKGKQFDKTEYVNFLRSLNYLVEEKDDFKIETSNVDEEISTIAGPQLVVPVDNAR